MGLVSSILIVPYLVKVIKRIFQLHQQIGGNWTSYWRLRKQIKEGDVKNDRFKLYDVNKIDDPRHLTLVPFEEEWDLECPSKVSTMDWLKFKRLIVCRTNWRIF